MKRYVTTLLICLLAGQYVPAAENINFYSDGTITTGQEWHSVTINDTPPGQTTVSMAGGTVWSVDTWNTSVFNFGGGYISGEVSAYSQSTVNISAAGVQTASALGSSTLNICGGADLSNVYGSGGTVNVYGGTIDILGGSSGSTMNLYGGDVTGYLAVSVNAMANIFGTDLFKTDTGGVLGGGQVTGLWEGSTTGFTIDISTGSYSRINLITIPEPASLLLLVLGGLLASHRKV